MGGLEALYWAKTYPDEVAAIIGLDMAVPQSYDSLDFEAERAQIAIARRLSFFGLSRILGGDSYQRDLDAEAIAQQNRLTHRNFLNISVYNELLALLDNAEIVKNATNPSQPMLLFVSNGEAIGDFWVPTITNFANENEALMIKMAVGHYIFQHEPEFIAKQAIEFLNQHLD